MAGSHEAARAEAAARKLAAKSSGLMGELDISNEADGSDRLAAAPAGNAWVPPHRRTAEAAAPRAAPAAPIQSKERAARPEILRYMPPRVRKEMEERERQEAEAAEAAAEAEVAAEAARQSAVEEAKEAGKERARLEAEGRARKDREHRELAEQRRLSGAASAPSASGPTTDSTTATRMITRNIELSQESKAEARKLVDEKRGALHVAKQAAAAERKVQAERQADIDAVWDDD